VPSSKRRRIKLSYSARYNRDFLHLERSIAESVKKKLALFQENPWHPSLRVKKIRGREGIWELSVTEQYRVTFEWAKAKGEEQIVILRRVGTHDILRTP